MSQAEKKWPEWMPKKLIAENPELAAALVVEKEGQDARPKSHKWIDQAWLKAIRKSVAGSAEIKATDEEIVEFAREFFHSSQPRSPQPK